MSMIHQPALPVVTERQLPEWLLQYVPAVADAYRSEMEDYPGPHPSAYLVLSFVLQPYLVEQLDAGDEQEVQRIFDLLEYLAQHGDASVQNDLWVTMEELDIWRVWKFLGPILRAGAFEDVTWLPDIPANAHVSRARYRQRWQMEIENIGGWEHLTDAYHMWFRYRLVQEFGIVGLRAPEPGGDEWRQSGLQWPIPNQ